MPIHDKLGILKNAANGEYSYGKRDLFAAVLGIKILLSYMGFPENWVAE